MTLEEQEQQIRRLADAKCQRTHRDFYDSLICVGPGSEKGFGPPCDSCLAETREEYELKRRKAHGVELTPEEAEEIRKKLDLF